MKQIVLAVAVGAAIGGVASLLTGGLSIGSGGVLKGLLLGVVIGACVSLGQKLIFYK